MIRGNNSTKKYHGIIPPIISPVREDESIDTKGYEKLLEHCIRGGVHGIFVAGTNGETMALTQKARNEIIAITLEKVDGRIPVIAGVMDTSTKRVVENIRELEKLGGTCAAVTSIFYDRHTSQDETVRHFDSILSKTNLDIAVYNIPTFTGIRLTADTIIKIAGLDDRIVAYKDSSAHYVDFLKVLNRCRGDGISILQGVTGHAMSSLLMGADGFVPALAPVFPELFVSAYEAGKGKNIERIRRYDDLLMKSSAILGMTKNATAAAKYAISLLGHTRKEIIFPQDSITGSEEESIRMKVSEINREYSLLKKEEEGG